MKFIEIVRQLSSFDEDQTIFLDRSDQLSAETEGVVVWMPEDDATPSDAIGMKCFLDIWHAIEIIEGKSRLLGIRNPSDREKLELLIQYTETDA